MSMLARQKEGILGPVALSTEHCNYHSLFRLG